MTPDDHKCGSMMAALSNFDTLADPPKGIFKAAEARHLQYNAA